MISLWAYHRLLRLHVVAEQLLQRSHVLIQDNELGRRAVAEEIQHSSCNRRLNIRC